MANVKFLKGTQQKFNTLSSFTDGAFYLTTDTDRLYFAQSETECVPLNQFIRTVTAAEFNALTTAQVSKGDYYYVIDENILAICKDNNATLTWTQLNPDTNDNTSFDEIHFGSSLADNTVTITETLREVNKISGDPTGSTLVGNLKLKGTNGIELTTENTEKSTTVTIEGDTYSLSTDMKDARQYEASVAYHVGDIVVIDGKYRRCKAEVAAGSNHSAAEIIGSFEELNAGISLVSANGQESSTFGFKAGDNVTIGQIDGQITVSATDTTLKENGLNISNNKTQGFDIKVSDTNNTVVGGTLDPVINVGSSGNSSVHFVNGEADLPVYTTSEIDSKFKGLNGMTYKGTVGTAALQNLPTSNVSSGDTYMVAADTTVNAKAVKNGDLFIATGTEGADGYIPSDGITWTYVPSGDDNFQNSTYEGIATPGSNTWGIQEASSDQLVGNIQLVAGTNMSISSKLGGADENITASMVTTINHGSVGAVSNTDVTDSTPEGGPTETSTFTAVTGVGRDGNGHVASVTTKQFNIKDTTYTFGTGVEDNKIVTKLTDSDQGIQAVKYGVTSSSLNVTTTAAATNDVTVNVELEWGSF